jgi:hypothetical protein
MKATLDRVEGDMAVLLIRNDESIKLNVPVALLPEGCREGDILDIIIARDDRATREAGSRVSSLLQKLKGKSRAIQESLRIPIIEPFKPFFRNI